MKIRIFALICLSVALSTAAQTLSTEITVDRTIVPEQTASAPLPSISQTAVETPVFAERLSLSEPYETYNFQARADSIMPPMVTGLPAAPSQRGYVTAGYFPAYRLALRAGYRIVDSKKTLLLASARFNGFTYHDPELKSGNALTDNDFDVNARLLQRFGRHVIDLQADFGCIGVKYPGGYSNSVSQSYNSGRARLKIGRTEQRFGYHFNCGVDYLAAKDSIAVPLYPETSLVEPASQTFLTAALGAYVSTKTGAHTFAFNGYLSYLKQNGYHILVDMPMLIKGGPEYTYRSSKLTARAGLSFQIATGTDNRQDDDWIRIYPDIELRWMPWRQVALYGRISGDCGLNSLRRQLDYCPFTTPFALYDPRFDKESAVVGVDFGRPDALRAHIEGEASHWRGIAMPNSIYNYSYFKQGSVDCTKLNIGAGYTVRALMNLSLDVDYTMFVTGDDKGSPKNPDNPSSIFDVKLSISPLARLNVGIRYHLRTNRHAVADWPDMRFDLGNVSNLNLAGTYRYNDRLTLGLTLENVLCHRYLVMPTIVSPSMTGMLSATYTF